MRLPIEPRVYEDAKGVIHIGIEMPSWKISSLIKWILIKRVDFDQLYEIHYKPKNIKHD